jgi:ubiquinone biosynthesis protein
VLIRTARETLKLAQLFVDAPQLTNDILHDLREGQLEVGFVHKGLDEFSQKISVAFNRLVIALIVAGGLIGSSLIGIFAESGPHVLGVHVISIIGFALSGFLGIWLLWAVLRSGRL